MKFKSTPLIEKTFNIDETISDPVSIHFFCRGNSQKEVKYISKLFKMIALLCLVCAHLCLNSKNGNTEMKMKLLPESRKLYQNKAGDP